jgi:hypothetical protein
MHKSGIPIAAILPIIVVGLLFVGYCWYDILKGKVKHLPKWLWMVICALSVPLGGIVYLLVGRNSDT